ncbi:uncharacterized protein LOC123323021 isoform X2 [Coccinella septempunctata]|uniref:uncharacterized protein LOC123323021 isoform X2 n=1 Tax=Coccinella septempunctata TaxID=41139 RepID=UPI001D08E3B6|nr:uncharacterized protein LOC123323021 isoform X2 [Coccinella septempunctata]
MEKSDVTHKIKECVGNVENSAKIESQADMATLHPDKSGKWSVKLLMFYNRHFPTDKDSYAVRLPIIALWHDYRERREYYIWALIVLISASTYGLYYGIKIGDRKQFTPWIIFKIIEIISTTDSLLNIFIHGHIYGNTLTNVILGFIVLGGNSFLLWVICHRQRDNLEDVPEAVDEFSPMSTV